EDAGIEQAHGLALAFDDERSRCRHGTVDLGDAGPGEEAAEAERDDGKARQRDAAQRWLGMRGLDIVMAILTSDLGHHVSLAQADASGERGIAATAGGASFAPSVGRNGASIRLPFSRRSTRSVTARTAGRWVTSTIAAPLLLASASAARRAASPAWSRLA